MDKMAQHTIMAFKTEFLYVELYNNDTKITTNAPILCQNIVSHNYICIKHSFLNKYKFNIQLDVSCSLLYFINSPNNRQINLNGGAA